MLSAMVLNHIIAALSLEFFASVCRVWSPS